MLLQSTHAVESGDLLNSDHVGSHSINLIFKYVLLVSHDQPLRLSLSLRDCSAIVLMHVTDDSNAFEVSFRGRSR